MMTHCKPPYKILLIGYWLNEMQFTLIGTAAAPGIPVYGCHCSVCVAARQNGTLQRQKTSAVLQQNGKTLLLDANADNFLSRFPYGSYDGILLTHFHLDHVAALFDIRWGVGEKIPVYIPNDRTGADDLFKHSGLLDFQIKPSFSAFEWQGLAITPIPLNHSRPTHGYIIDNGNQRIAYLTDTAWMGDAVLAWLQQNPVHTVLLDTSHAPFENGKAPRNHHDVYQAKKLFTFLKPQAMGLIHVTHDVLLWAEQYPDFFNAQFFIAYDNQQFVFG